jgi:hypothetical protein
MKQIEKTYAIIKDLPYKEQKRFKYFTDYLIMITFFSISQKIMDMFQNKAMENAVLKMTYKDFFLRHHKDEAGKKTKGIQTLYQLEQFIQHFNSQVKNYQKIYFNILSDVIQQFDIKKKKTVLNELLYSTRMNNLFDKTEFSDVMERFLKIEKDYLENAAKYKNFDKEKPYKSKDRAYGYFMAMAMQNGKINIAPDQKTELIQYMVEHEINPTGAIRSYTFAGQYFRGLNDRDNEIFKKDISYAKELYLKHFE